MRSPLSTPRARLLAPTPRNPTTARGARAHTWPTHSPRDSRRSCNEPAPPAPPARGPRRVEPARHFAARAAKRPRAAILIEQSAATLFCFKGWGGEAGSRCCRGAWPRQRVGCRRRRKRAGARRRRGCWLSRPARAASRWERAVEWGGPSRPRNRQLKSIKTGSRQA